MTSGRITGKSPALRRIRHVTPFATSGALASSRDALQTVSDLRAYRPCHRRDGTAGTPELIYRCYHRRAASLSVMTTGRAQQPEDGLCRQRRRRSRDSHESVAGRPEQLADVGRSDPALRGLNDYASTGSGPTRQSDARDSEPLLVSVDVARAGYCFDCPLLLFT